MSAMIGRVVTLTNTEQTGTDEGGECHGVVVDGFVLDNIEARYLVAVLEEGRVDGKVDGLDTLTVGTLVCVSHRDIAMAPAPEEAKELAGQVAHANRSQKRRIFREGTWHDA